MTRDLTRDPSLRSGQAPPPERLTIDVSLLPEAVFGHRGVTYWATAGFMLIEGTTLVLLVAAYLYLRLQSAEWPPRPASNPKLLWPTVNLVLMLVKCWPMHLASKSARNLDSAGVRRWGTVASLLATTVLGVRWLEFESLNVHWNENAYGSAVWGIMAAHTLLLVTDVLESWGIVAVFLLHKEEAKHFPDVEDDAVYEYFLVSAWVVLWAVLYLGPRVL
jgi:cytochrome c oxidase subunit III